MVTDVPTVPACGEKLLICGVTRNCWLLVSVMPELVTATDPVVAPVGTVAVRQVAERT